MVNSHFIGSFAKLPSNASSCSSKHSRFIETFHWNKWIPVNLHHIYTRKPWQVKRSLGEGGDLFFSPKANMAMRSSSIYNVYINKFVFCWYMLFSFLHVYPWDCVYIYIYMYEMIHHLKVMDVFSWFLTWRVFFVWKNPHLFASLAWRSWR